MRKLHDISTDETWVDFDPENATVAEWQGSIQITEFGRGQTGDRSRKEAVPSF